MQNVIFDTPINYGLKILDPNSIAVTVYFIQVNLDILQCYLLTTYRLSAIIIINIIYLQSQILKLIRITLLIVENEL